MRYQCVVVESGLASRLVVGYIDMNPVRAGLVASPAAHGALLSGEPVKAFSPLDDAVFVESG